MSMGPEIKATILKVLPDATVYVADPDGEHFEAIVISEKFTGMPLVKQHKIVMNALKEHFKQAVHALALKTYTPEKWVTAKEKYNLPT